MFLFIFSIYQFDVFLDAIPNHNIQAKLHEDAMLIAFSIVNVSHKLDVWISKYVIPLKDAKQSGIAIAILMAYMAIGTCKSCLNDILPLQFNK
jgi:hypothetical protein